MAAKLKDKRTSITTVPNILRSFAIFATPLISHWSLPLSQKTFHATVPLRPLTRVLVRVKISLDLIKAINNFFSMTSQHTILWAIKKNLSWDDTFNIILKLTVQYLGKIHGSIYTDVIFEKHSGKRISPRKQVFLSFSFLFYTVMRRQQDKCIRF
jgi:hypothetical protein